MQKPLKTRKNRKPVLKFVTDDNRIKCLNCGTIAWPYYNKPLCRECAKTHSFCVVTNRVLPLSEFYPGHLSECKEATKKRATLAAKKRAQSKPKKYVSTRDVAKELLRKELSERKS
jgi:hypothetical protein